MTDSSITAAPADWKARAMQTLAEGDEASARAQLRAGLEHAIDLEALNDLAVLTYRQGDSAAAATLLRALLLLAPDDSDAATNLAAAEADTSAASWRRSKTLGGPDPGMFERAFPGMPRPDIISEHTSRYAFALSRVGGADVLDLGCGTGYGSEMLSWSARSVRGFDLWQPADDQRPTWPGVTSLTYGHNLCEDPLPAADAAVMFEVIEHLPDAPRALEIAWRSVRTIIGSFPNPVYHGSWMNQYHVNDWTLDQFEAELEKAAKAAGRTAVKVDHFHQPVKSPLLREGRDPDGSYWVIVAQAI